MELQRQEIGNRSVNATTYHCHASNMWPTKCWGCGGSASDLAMCLAGSTDETVKTWSVEMHNPVGAHVHPLKVCAVSLPDADILSPT